MRHGTCIGGWLAALLLNACAATASEQLPAKSPGLRVIVRLVQPSDDAAAIEQQAAQVARVPVRYAAAAGGNWHAIVLACSGETDCHAALQRLRDHPSLYAEVERDGRRKRARP